MAQVVFEAIGVSIKTVCGWSLGDDEKMWAWAGRTDLCWLIKADHHIPFLCTITVHGNIDVTSCSFWVSAIYRSVLSCCPGERHHCQRGWCGEGQDPDEPLRGRHQEPVEWPGNSGMLQAEEGIPALRFCQIVSVNRKTLGHGCIASAVSSESEFTLFIPFKAVEKKNGKTLFEIWFKK